jgi:hypothetical protein
MASLGAANRHRAGRWRGLWDCRPALQGTVTGKPYAIAFSIGATICNGLMMTFSSKLMRCGFFIFIFIFFSSSGQATWQPAAACI